MRSDRFCTLAARGLLLALTVIALFTFTHYGVTWDEQLQSDYGQAVYNYYLSGLRDDHYDEIFNLYLYGGLFDGLAAALEQVSPFRIFDTRHCLNALFGLLGLWGVWRAGRWFGGPRAGLLALVLCAATPMYYGHMFNNPKDIPFAAGLIWSLYYMARSFARPSLPIIVKLGLVFGFTLGVRVGGVMLAAFWGAALSVPALLVLMRARSGEQIGAALRGWARMVVRTVLPVGVIAYVLMLLCWPWAQQNPILNPLLALGQFSNFPQNVEVLLDGTTYWSTKLPWYYVPRYFAIQLPLFFMALLALFVFALPWAWRRWTFDRRQAAACFLLMALFPILYAMLRRPALYDAVRHFLFFIPIMSVLIAASADMLMKSLSESRAPLWLKRSGVASFVLASLVCIAAQTSAMMHLHPYEYMYANELAGGVRGIYGRYELDYWGASFKDAAHELEKIVNVEGGVPPGKIYRVAICGPWDAVMIYMPPNFDPVVANEPAEFFISTTRWMCQNMRPGNDIVTIERMGVPLAVIKDLRGGYEYYSGNESMWPETLKRQHGKAPARDKAKAKSGAKDDKPAKDSGAR